MNILKYALAALVGVALTVAVWFGVSVYQKFGALKVAWTQTEVVQGLQISRELKVTSKK